MLRNSEANSHSSSWLMPARNANLIAVVDEDHSELSRRITHAFRPKAVGTATEIASLLDALQRRWAIRAKLASPQFDRDQLAQALSSEPVAETAISSRLL
jgi:hypothetical protein